MCVSPAISLSSFKVYAGERFCTSASCPLNFKGDLVLEKSICEAYLIKSIGGLHEPDYDPGGEG
jgi:hypothetical protein